MTRGTKDNWLIWVEHAEHGRAGIRAYYGTEVGCKRAAMALARTASAELGVGWRPKWVVWELAEPELVAPSWGVER